MVSMSGPDEGDVLMAAAGEAGARYGMTGSQMLAHVAVGDVPHPNAPADVCGKTDPRSDHRWCVLAPVHPGEGHNRYAPADGCRTWGEHARHEPRSVGQGR
jgi:hypothetical protein